MLSRYLIFAMLFISFIGCNSSGESVPKAKKYANIIELKQSDTSVYVTATSRNIGTLYEGEKVEGVLNIQNCSDTVSNIVEIKASCGCMAIDQKYSKRLEKGEVMSLEYTIDTSLKSGEEYFDIIIISSTGKYVIELIANVK